MKTLKLEDFRSQIKAQGVSDRIHAAFQCSMCKTVQSMASFANAGVDFETAKMAIGFSCIGRFMGGKSPRKVPDGNPCNWTLGGLFRFHGVEVIDDDGNAHPHFELATPEEAQALEAANTKIVGQP